MAKSKKLDRASTEDILLEMVKKLQLLNTGSDIYVTVSRENHKENLLIDSKAFARYLKSRFHDKYGEFPSDNIIKDITDYVQDSAAELGAVEARYRVAREGDTIYYDLADGNCVEITKSGWAVTRDTPNFFLHLGEQKVQDTPIAGEGDISRLKKYVGNLPDEDWILLVAYIVSCFVPSIQHPVCNISGSNGSGKSTLSRVLKELIDPSITNVETLNSSLDNITARLNSTYYAAFDNLSYLTKKQSDFLCGAVTGTAVTKRKLYENNTSITVKLKGNLCLNGITDFVKRPDMAERCLFFKTERLREKRIPEGDFWSSFEEDKPYILAGIFDLLSAGFAEVDSVKVFNPIRMLDFQKWGLAITDTMGVTSEFSHRLTANKWRQLEISFDNSVLVRLLDDYLSPGESHQDTTSGWFKHLRDFMNEADDEEYNKEHYPKDAARFAQRLMELEGVLEGYGITLERYRNSENYSCLRIDKKMVRIPVFGKRTPIILLGNHAA